MKRLTKAGAFCLAFSSLPRDYHRGRTSSTELTAVIPAALWASPLLAELQVQFLPEGDDPPFSTSKVVGFRITRGDSDP